jgi:protein O-GlcNAc transferase
LIELRAGLRENVRRSPLCDAPRFGRNLGTALRQAWQAWCLEPQLPPLIVQSV